MSPVNDMSRPKWSKRRPSVKGLYWYRLIKDRSKVYITTIRDPKEPVLIGIGMELFHPTEFEWWGPVKPPK